MLRTSPLDAQHRGLSAKMAGFGGWSMPIAYATGTLAEHGACRRGVAMFDVSHLGTVRVDGSGSFEALQGALTNDLARISPGAAQYTHLLNDDGGVEDDIIVWWRSESTFDVMPNASNTDRVLGALGGVDVTASRAVLAVQGPEARSTVATFSLEAAQVARFKVADVSILGIDCTVAGTGYTGEDGIEIAVPADGAANLWQALLEAGAVPAGLGARDTLRLEAGLPLHGHEISPSISPLEAGLGWVVAWDKPNFIGRAALERQRETGPSRRLRGIRLEGRRPARDGSTVLDPAGRALGTVTSGNFSPTLECAVALALVDASVEIGQTVQFDIRGERIAGTVVKTPFVR